MRALFLIGSPKPGSSASRSFAEAVSTRLVTYGWETRTERIGPAVSDETRLAGLLSAIAEADLVVLAFPVYVDSLPAPVLRLLERWHEAARGEASGLADSKRLAVLAQCGFPEGSHADVAVEVCRIFAETTGLKWSGALAFGMGASIEGRPVEKSMLAGRAGALDAAVAALAAGGEIGAESTAAFREPLVPGWTYPLAGWFSWRKQARDRGCSEPLNLRRCAQ